MPPVVCSPLVSFIAPSLGLPCLLASYATPVSSAPHGVRCLPPPFASPHRLIVSSLPRIARLPVPSTSGAGRGRDRRRESRRAADGGGRAVIVAGLRLLACLGAMDGAARSSLFPISSATVLGSSNHPIDGELASFPFRLTPSRPLFSACLPWLVPPSPAGGCAGCGMACGGGRAGCLLVFSSHVPLVRLLLYAPGSSLCVVLSGALCDDLRDILDAILSALAYFNICP